MRAFRIPQGHPPRDLLKLGTLPVMLVIGTGTSALSADFAELCGPPAKLRNSIRRPPLTWEDASTQDVPGPYLTWTPFIRVPKPRSTSLVRDRGHLPSNETWNSHEAIGLALRFLLPSISIFLFFPVYREFPSDRDPS